MLDHTPCTKLWTLGIARLRASSPFGGYCENRRMRGTREETRRREKEGLRRSLGRSLATRFARPNRRACSQAKELPGLCTAFSLDNRDSSILRLDGNENVKNNSFKFSRQNKNFARACHFSVHFFATTWNCLILLFREDVNKRQRNFIISKLEDNCS